MTGPVDAHVGAAPAVKAGVMAGWPGHAVPAMPPHVIVAVGAVPWLVSPVAGTTWQLAHASAFANVPPFTCFA